MLSHSDTFIFSMSMSSNMLSTCEYCTLYVCKLLNPLSCNGKCTRSLVTHSLSLSHYLSFGFRNPTQQNHHARLFIPMLIQGFQRTIWVSHCRPGFFIWVPYSVTRRQSSVGPGTPRILDGAFFVTLSVVRMGGGKDWRRRDTVMGGGEVPDW